MRTIAPQTAYQRALKNCSKEVGGNASIYGILVKGKYMQSSTFFSFCRFLLVMRNRCHHEVLF